MAGALVWISGASSGIGRALARTVPWPGSRVIDVSRRGGTEGTDHLAADLSDPASWPVVGESFSRESASFEGDRVVFVHSAGSLDPIGFAGEVDSGAYRDNVVLNSAAPQVLGHLFLAAVQGLTARRQLLMVTSGAARNVYPGWSSYGAAKAAVDQWVRNVGAEQASRGGVEVLAVAPGTVDTDMQAALRGTGEDQFPSRQRFVDLHSSGRLTDPAEVAARMWRLLDGPAREAGSVVDLRDLVDAPG